MHKIVGADAHIRPFLKHHNFLQRDDVGIVPYKNGSCPLSVRVPFGAFEIKKEQIQNVSTLLNGLDAHIKISFAKAKQP